MGRLFADVVINRVNVADSWSKGVPSFSEAMDTLIVFTSVEISVNDLVLLQLLKALDYLYFVGVSGVPHH